MTEQSGINDENATKVVNVRTAQRGTYVYIGRPTIYGNPFAMKSEADREQVVAQYRTYAWKRYREDEQFRAAIDALEGKVLGCYCAPKLCHGDIIARLLEYTRTNPD